MPTLAIYTTDLHIDDYKPFSSNRDRLEDCLLVLDDLYKIARKKGAKIILFSGDLFNTPKFLFTKVLTATIHRFSKLIAANPDIIWYAITGNHDFATKNLLHTPTISALEHLATAFPEHFKLYDNRAVMWEEGYGICGIPNYEFKEHFQSKLEEMSQLVADHKRLTPKVKVTLMIHQSPEGQYNTHVRTNTSPSDPLYEAFDMVLCGDIHTSQRITETFLLGGNPLHQVLTDEGKEKGVWLMDLENPTDIQFISRKGRYPEFKRVKKGQPVADDESNFIVQEADVPMLSDENGIAELTKFGSSLPHDELLTNFWKTAEGKDEKLLATGLSFFGEIDFSDTEIAKIVWKKFLFSQKVCIVLHPQIKHHF